MRNLLVILLFAIVATQYGDCQSSRATRATRATTRAAVPPSGPNRQQGGQAPRQTRATTRAAPVRPGAPSVTTRPGAPTRQNQATRATPPATSPPRATPPGSPTARPTAPATNQPRPTAPATNQPRPTAPATNQPRPPAPTTNQPRPPAPTTTPNRQTPSQIPEMPRRTTIQPRISVHGVPDPRCPVIQDARNPVHLPHTSNW